MRPGPRRQRPDAPVAITAVAPSLDDQHDARKRKYLIMMGLRVVCVIAAFATYSLSLWLALAFIVGGAVLPWCAVLIANDRPPIHRTGFVRYRHTEDAQALEADRHRDAAD
jgi:Flp pilus assembly protein TadB